MIPSKKIAQSIIVLSSPNYLHYKELLDQNSGSLTYYMPLWTESELKKLDPVVKNWWSGYEIFEGVPRYILYSLSDPPLSKENFEKKQRDSIHEIIKSKGKYIINNFFIYESMSVKDDEMNSLIVHKIPTQSDDCLTTNYTSSSYKISSLYIRKALMDLDKKAYYNNAKKLINRGTLDIEKMKEYNDLFEDCFLYLSKPTQGSTVEKKPQTK